MDGRARKGGQIGRNGEAYKGGQFLPSTTLPKTQRERRGGGRVLVAPFEWAVAPEGKRSIFDLLGPLAARDWARRDAVVLTLNSDAVACYGATVRGYDAAELVDRFNRGERWA